jgi:hypothetical protein
MAAGDIIAEPDDQGAAAAAPAPQPGRVITEEEATQPSLSGATAVGTGAMNLPLGRDLAAIGATAGSYIPGAEQQTGTFGERYVENKRWLDMLAGQSAQQHPYLYYGSAMLSAAPLASVVAPKTAAGAAGVSAVMGTASGAGEGVWPKERVENAALSGVLGGTVGLGLYGAGQGAGYLASKGFGLLTSPKDLAMERTTGALQSDVAKGRGMDPNEWAAAQGAGYPVIAADMGGKPTQALARSVANMSPEARDALQATVGARASGQNQRLADMMDSVFGGGSLDTKVARDTILRNAQTENTRNYGVAYSAPNAQALWNPDLQNLLRSPGVQGVLSAAQKKAEEYAVQNKLPLPKNPFVRNPDGTVDLAVGPNGQRQIPSLMYWDQVKRSLQDAETSALRTGDKETARDYGTLKRSLLGTLDQVVPQYQTARQGAMAGFNAENALDAGLNYLKETRPDQLRQMDAALAQMNPADKAEFSRGFGAAVQGKALSTADNKNIVNQFNNPVTRQKFVNALGPLNAQRVEASLRWERVMESTNRAITGNSTTPQQFADMANESPFARWGEFGRKVAEGAVGGREMFGHIGALAGGGMAAAMHLYNQAAVKAGANPEIASFIASNLASGDPQKVNAMLNHIASRPLLMKVLRGVESGLPSVTAGPAAGAFVGAAGPSGQGQ